MRQTVNSAVTRYTLELSGGLTQVLYDETKSYVYGLDMISQQTVSDEEYPLRDALGSIRQLTDQSSAITMFNSYEPYGEIFSSSGSGSSSYGFAGEWTDATGLVHLRARYYDPNNGKFIQPDVLFPDPFVSKDWNRYLYVRANPINYVDPSGYITREESSVANVIVAHLKSGFNISIPVDWGDTSYNYYWVDPVDGSNNGVRTVCGWKEGLWELEELRSVFHVAHIAGKGISFIGGRFTSLAGALTIERVEGTRSSAGGSKINLRDDIENDTRRPAIIIHEIGHAITTNQPWSMTTYMNMLRSRCENGETRNGIAYCNEERGIGSYIAGSPSSVPSSYSLVGNWEDFAETFTVVVSEAYIQSGNRAYLQEAKLIYEQNGYNTQIGKRRNVMRLILGGH